MQLHRNIDVITGAGAALYVIGNGGPSFIAGFRETTGYDGTIYTDPSRAVFEAAQLKRGLGTIFTIATLRRSWGAFRRGFRQGRTQGDALQQGGALAIAPDGRVLWHQVSSGPGDNASAADIASALRSAA